MCAHVCMLSRVWLYNLVDCSPPGSSVHGVSQTRILSGLPFPSSRVSFQPKDWTLTSCISCTGRQIRYYQSGAHRWWSETRFVTEVKGQSWRVEGRWVVSRVRAFQKAQRGAQSKPGSHSICKLCGMQVPKAASLGTTTLHPEGIPRPTGGLRKAFPLMYGCAQSLSHVRLFATLWTVANQAPLSLGFSRKEFWVGCQFLPQGIFLTQG